MANFLPYIIPLDMCNFEVKMCFSSKVNNLELVLMKNSFLDIFRLIVAGLAKLILAVLDILGFLAFSIGLTSLASSYLAKFN